MLWIAHRSLWLALALLLLLALICSAALASLLAHREKEHLQPLSHFASRLAAGDLSARLQNPHKDRMGGVAHALDTAAARLERSFGTLASSRNELETLLDSMQEAVVAVDANGRIQWTNRVMQSMMAEPGGPGGVRVGYSLVQTIRDPAVLLCVRNTLEQRTVSEGKASSVVPGRTFEVSVAPTPGGGAVAVLHDISEVERVETTRRDFIANVSHELRTPLTSISGYVETLLDHLQPETIEAENPDQSNQRGGDNSPKRGGGRSPAGASGSAVDPQVREFLHIILKNATRMNRLTEDLLALARVESGEHKLRPVPVEASVLVEDALDSLSGLAHDFGVRFEIGELARQKVMADYDAIQQVLSNLIENAIKYGCAKNSPVGGIVAVSAVEDEKGIMFSVRDSGPGIAYEHLDRIFERFYRVDKARSKESGGTGLGLAIAKHIVIAHGGTIRAESVLNMGSTFSFTLPAAPAASDTPALATSEAGM